MKSLFFLIVPVLFGIMLSCTEEVIVKSVEAKYKEFDASILSVDADDEDVDPDSLLTIEQLRTKYMYHKTYDKYLDIAEDGRLIFSMSEEEWLSTGLPKSYYDAIIQSFSSFNHRFADIKDNAERNRIKEALQEGKTNYSKKWSERYAKVKHLIKD
ncbi:MAG: hypothetical protein LBE04_01100 [Prevotellaceae bacterium]|jgi:hypothetical protein|nr:hypothetical protein [Prevotellaceae bacterium]